MSVKLHSHFARAAAPNLITYLVVCEGQTEAQYFKQWERILRGKVKFRILANIGSPKTLVERALEEKKALIRSSPKHSDIRVWCVGDRDDHSRMEEALDHARRKGINYALSIPCVELWFLLHFENQRANLHRDVAIRRSKVHLKIGSKNLSSDALDLLHQNFEIAIHRGRQLDEMHKGNGSDNLENPRSGIHSLVDELRSH